jgi:hypothetical protein
VETENCISSKNVRISADLTATCSDKHNCIDGQNVLPAFAMFSFYGGYLQIVDMVNLAAFKLACLLHSFTLKSNTRFGTCLCNWFEI